ncbi:hypothetical protein GCM10023224_46330 [Streptomonospora halophila]|uniref:Uncharacterized protein n=1 Tax=Streptomonospora halophila TaxID=427369 RepID=A0ABP9GX92_9ACTN
MWPGVWPGVHTVRSLRPGRSTGSPSESSRSGGAGGLEEGCRFREPLQLGGCRPGLGSAAQLPGVLFVGADAGEAADQFRVGAVHGDPGAGGRAHASGEPGVVGVEVGDHNAVHVADRGARGLQPGGEGSPGVLVVPSRVDEHRSSRAFQHVDEGVAEGVAGDGHGHAPHALAQILHRWQRPHGILLLNRKTESDSIRGGGASGPRGGCEAVADAD